MLVRKTFIIGKLSEIIYAENISLFSEGPSPWAASSLIISLSRTDIAVGLTEAYDYIALNQDNRRRMEILGNS